MLPPSITDASIANVTTRSRSRARIDGPSSLAIPEITGGVLAGGLKWEPTQNTPGFPAERFELANKGQNENNTAGANAKQAYVKTIHQGFATLDFQTKGPVPPGGYLKLVLPNQGWVIGTPYPSVDL